MKLDFPVPSITTLDQQDALGIFHHTKFRSEPMSKDRKLQVFISSTFSDLIDERQSAVSAILKSGHIPAGMELFTAGDQSQMQTIRKWIDQSDVYLLILGGRYGSIEETTKLSYTELEYDYAVENDKPIFSIVLNEEYIDRKVKTHGKSVIEQSEPKQLSQFREKVLKKISTFAGDEKDIRLAVLESLADIVEDSRVVGWVRSDQVPDQSAINAELRKVREEKDSLQTKVNELTKTIEKSAQSNEKLDTDLIETLCGIELIVPAGVAENDEEAKINLFEFAVHNRDILVLGVENRADISTPTSFIYFNVMPKLQAHGLADNERVPTKAYRRSYLNKKGQNFLAQVEKTLVKNKLDKDKADAKNDIVDGAQAKLDEKST